MQCTNVALSNEIPSLTVNRLGAIPIEEIDHAFSASVAAVLELQNLGTNLAVPLLEYGLSVYHVDAAKLASTKPHVILTCLQTAHGSILEGPLLDHAMHAVLGYVPNVVHCSGENLESIYNDMQAIADACKASERGKQLIENQKKKIQFAHEISRGREHPRVACFQWPMPLMASSSWVPELIRLSGGVDVCGKQEETVVVDRDILLKSQPDVIIFALCGVKMDTACKAAMNVIRKFGEDAWNSLPAVKSKKVAVVDGEEIFTRPGPLLVDSVECLIEIFYYEEAHTFGHFGKKWKWLGG